MKEASSSFLKKRTKKLLSDWFVTGVAADFTNEQNFFGSFFQKRTACFL
jgi:hypothetical protein